MKIVYSYWFDVTKRLERSEEIPFVLEFIKENGLACKRVEFCLQHLKPMGALRKSYLEGLAEKDPEWGLSLDLAESFQGVQRISLSNRQSMRTETVKDIADKLAEPMQKMPKSDSYKICFDGISWFSGCDFAKASDSRPYTYPLTSNISLYNYAYNNTHYIALNFLMNECGGAHLSFVNRFSTRLEDLPYTKEVFFLSEETDPPSLLPEQDRHIRILPPNVEIHFQKRLKLKESIREIFSDFNFVSFGNGGYEAWKTDAFHNKLSVIFDYDRENHLFCASLFYIGANIKNAVHFSESEKLYYNEPLKDYLQKVHQEVVKFQEESAPILAKAYPVLPEWFEW